MQGAILPLNGLVLWRLYICHLFQGDLASLHPSQGWELEVVRRLPWIHWVGNLPPPSECWWQREPYLADEQRGSRWAGCSLSAKTAGVTPHLLPQELLRLSDHMQREWEGSNGKGESREQRGRDTVGSGRRSATDKKSRRILRSWWCLQRQQENTGGVKYDRAWVVRLEWWRVLGIIGNFHDNSIYYH